MSVLTAAPKWWKNPVEVEIVECQDTIYDFTSKKNIPSIINEDAICLFAYLQ